jgi:hypothetical protein
VRRAGGGPEELPRLLEAMRAHYFGVTVALSTLAGAGVRVGYVLKYKWNNFLFGGDFLYYHGFADDFAHFRWPQGPFFGGPSASHPPLFPLLLVPGNWVGLTTPGQQVLENCVIGAVTIVPLAYLARRLFGPPAGCIAAVIGALSPSLWIYDGQGLSEPTEVLVFMVLMLACYGYLEDSTLSRAIVFGVLAGLLALARSEQLAQLVVLGPYMVWRHRKRFKTAALHLGAMALAAALVLSPWSVHNLLTFKYPEPLSTQLGGTLETANCYPTYYGKLLGYWDINCSNGIKLPSEESQADKVYLSITFDFVRSHLSRLPVVMLARLGRMWNLYAPFQEAGLDTVEGWAPPWNKVELYVFWFSLPFVAGGLLAARLRKVRVYPLAVQFVLTSLVAMAVYGQQRYRAAAESLFPVLTAGCLTNVALLNELYNRGKARVLGWLGVALRPFGRRA